MYYKEKTFCLRIRHWVTYHARQNESIIESSKFIKEKIKSYIEIIHKEARFVKHCCYNKT